MPSLGEWLLYTFLTTSLWTRGVHGAKDNTTCISSQLAWYTDAVGETPCVTYQRLRQICNADYQVQKFNTITPGDSCNDQLKDCCCNSVSWALSMLCMNCQYFENDGSLGIDAGECNGAYEKYLGSCLNIAVNMTLPDDVQSAVCNEKIKIDRNLYNLFWSTGAWYVTYTRDSITEDLVATNNNTFTHCASTTVNTTTTKAGTSTATGSSKPHSTASSIPQSSSNTAVVIGAAVGGALGAIALGLVGFWFWYQRRRAQGPKPLDLTGEYQYKSEAQPGQLGTITPFSAPSTHDSNSRYDGSTGHDSGEPESIALLPRGSPGSTFGASAIGSGSTGTTAIVSASVTTGSARPSKFSGRNGHPPPSFPFDEDKDRHKDGGPVPFLHRSASGRLPPAYQSWDDEPSDVVSAMSHSQSGTASSIGAVPSGASAAGYSEPVQPPPPPEQRQYPRDVKRPIPS
ncbi:hypothetical protein LXA43DRAFT_893016 [Ganoderma leucocontextum]|nr:hypothetical protein LXA43DRAFT_893016 [Ganoderma leucocontextum]